MDSFVTAEVEVVGNYIEENSEEEICVTKPKTNYYAVAYHKKPTHDTNNCGSKGPTGIKDWNAEFQEIMDNMANSSEDTTLFDKLSALAADFTFVAKTYGKIIILEHYLPDAAKTIKPIQIGGLAGGEKYISQGILFKFAMDIHGIYGGDEYSMKAASHDLKGLMGYYKCQIPGLHFPLMTLIDFRGYRLVAMSLLPLSQLLYGSNDGGVTVYNRDSALNDLMSITATKLNLKSHFVGNQHVMVHAPADIEGHLGTDGRFYLLDFARTFPPEAPVSVPHKSVMYYRLRSEFVKKFGTPLSSDAYSAFGKDDADIHDKEVKQATKYLKNVVIPDFSRWLEDQSKERNWMTTRTHVASWMHREGINVRHLGLIRACYFSPEENDNSSQSVCSSSSSTMSTTSTSSSATRSSTKTSSSSNLMSLVSSPSFSRSDEPPPLVKFNSANNISRSSLIKSTPAMSRSSTSLSSSTTATPPSSVPATSTVPAPSTVSTVSPSSTVPPSSVPPSSAPSSRIPPASPKKLAAVTNKQEKTSSNESQQNGSADATPKNSSTASPLKRNILANAKNSRIPVLKRVNLGDKQDNSTSPPGSTALVPPNSPTPATTPLVSNVTANATTPATNTTTSNTNNSNNNNDNDDNYTKSSSRTEISGSNGMSIDNKFGMFNKSGLDLNNMSFLDDFASSSDSVSINSSPRSSGAFDPLSMSGVQRSGTPRREGSIKSSSSSLNVSKSLQSNQSAAHLLLHEMIARVVKTTLREKLRFRMQLVPTPSEKPFKLEILEYLNLVLGRKPESEFYWQNDIKHEILRKFHKSLTQQEREIDYPLSRGIDMCYVLDRVMKMTGVRIQQTAMDQLRANPDSFQFVYPDIEKMSATVKDMNIVAHAEGTSLYMQSVKQKGQEGDRLFLLAMERYEAALTSTPDNMMMLKNWGDALYQQGLRKVGEDRAKLFVECAEKFRASKNYDSLLTLAKNLHEQAKKEAGRDREQLFSLANENFKSTLEIYRGNAKLVDYIPNLFMLWGNMLWDQAITRVGMNKAEGFFVAGQKYMEGCELLYATQGTKAISFMVKEYPALSSMSPADFACLMRISVHDQTLTSVDATHCNKQISDDIIRFLAIHHPLLHTLKLAGCKNISLNAFRVSFPSLTYLDIQECQMGTSDKNPLISILATNTPSLTSLFLGNNPLLTLASPSSDVSFAKLHTLDLQLCRSLAPDFAVDLCGRCPALTNLNMAGCVQLSDADIARILKTGTKIKEINFSRCKLSDAALIRTGGLTGLRVGYCGGITKSSLGPLIGRSPALSHVKLPGCLVTDSIVISIAKHCPLLTTLDVSHCSITDYSLFEVAERSTNLTYLGLNKCQQITNEAIIRVTQHCTKLENIVLKLGGLYKMGPEGLASAAHHCPSLVALDIHGCERIESSTIVLLAHNCPKLTSINLGDCRLVTDMAIVKLSQRCTSLTSVNLFNCRNIHNESLLSLAQNCPNLADLGMAFTAITASGIDSLAKLSRSSLRVLGLSQCKIITDMALISLANHCPMLEDLDLNSCYKIGDLAIMNIAKYLGGSLRALGLGGCYKLTDTSIMRIAQDSPNLEILKVGNCYKLTDASIIKLAQHCPNITTLLINGCKQLTDASIIALADNAHNLQKFSVESCPLISRPALLELRQKCPMLVHRSHHNF